MEELYRQLIGIVYGMWRRRWYGVVAAWLLCLVGWGVVATMPDNYQSFARIYIDTSPMLKPLMAGMTVDVNVRGQIEVMKRTLTSRPNLSSVVRMTDLDLTVETDAQMEALLERIRASVRISSQGGSLVRVAVENGDPQMAKRIVQALMTIFVETNLGRSRKDLAGARRFIDEQIREYELQLDGAEKRMADFRNDNMGFLGEENYYQQMTSANGKKKKLQATLKELIIRRDEFNRQLAAVPQYLTVTSPGGGAGGPLQFAGPASAGSGLSSNLYLRIQSLEQNRGQLLFRYTERHPDVVRLTREIDSLKEMSENMGPSLAAGPGDPFASAPIANSTISNPVYETTKLDIIKVETEIQVMRPRVVAGEQRVIELEKLAKTVPIVQTEMKRLNRDYGVLKNNYTQMVKRREQARLEQSIETKSDKVIYNMIEPPQVPIKPSSPDRPLLLSLVLLIGLGAGLGLTFVLSQISTTFITVQNLRDHFALPVLGSITALVTEPERRRKLLDYAMFGVTVVGLLLAYAGVVALEIYQEA